MVIAAIQGSPLVIVLYDYINLIMAGKMCFGLLRNNAYSPKDTKAFSEGVYHRSSGSALAKPLLDNPHPDDSSAGLSWIAGWTVANNASPGVIAKNSAPCVAIPSGNVSL